MKITARTVGKCKVLDCSGELIIGAAAAALHKSIREAVQDGTSKVVLDLGDVTYMDAAGLGAMISGHVHVIKEGGELLFLNPSKKIQTQIAAMKLLCIFEFIDDEQKALEGC